MEKKLDIITIGESLIELSTDEHLKSAENLKKFYGGDALATAVAASRMGSEVGFITRVGDDVFKDYLLSSWQNEHLDTSQVKIAQEQNGVYFISRPKGCGKEFAYYRKRIAPSMTFPKASSTLGRTSAQISYSESSKTASGIGTITAISSAVRVNLSHSALVVFFISVSPFKKYAVGKVEAIGNVFCLALMFGNCLNNDNAAEACGTFFIISEEVSTGIRASALEREIIFASSVIIFSFLFSKFYLSICRGLL